MYVLTVVKLLWWNLSYKIMKLNKIYKNLCCVVGIHSWEYLNTEYTDMNDPNAQLATWWYMCSHCGKTKYIKKTFKRWNI